MMNFCPRSRGRPRCQQAALSREQIIERAFLAFAELGYEQVSLRALAKDCGISDSLLHHHFGSKQQLWQEAADSYIAPLMATLTDNLEALAANDRPAQALRHNLPQSLKNMVSKPAALAFIFREGDLNNERSDYLRQRYMRPYLNRLDALFNQAVLDGDFRPIPPAARHVLIMGFLRSMVIPAHLQDELAPHLSSQEQTNALIDDIAQLLLHGFSQSSPPLLGATTHVQ
ncbi:MAG: TetR/AcrR family transcriptional regulator [Moraxellaceae bacterium]|nr:TetR/AcrR family transcriptional regulator [Pseudomonadales bacterium]MCP5177094.1 TetR/AcrR family transcriptional regulator [Moraxellaceae bacterium]